MSQPVDDPVGTPPTVANPDLVPASPEPRAAFEDAQAAPSDSRGAEEVVGEGRRPGINWVLVLAIIAADQLTKAVVRLNLDVYESVEIIPGLLNITHVHNPGVAFGLLSDLDLPFKPYATTALALLALAGIAYYARHIRPDERLARLGLSIILGGAIGNLIDRVRVAYVVDFVDLYWGTWHFWAFNVADASITIGAILVFFELLTHRHAPHPV